MARKKTNRKTVPVITQAQVRALGDIRTKADEAMEHLFGVAYEPGVTNPATGLPAAQDDVVPAEPVDLALRRAMKVRIDSRKGPHVGVSVFTGPDRDHLALTGFLTLDPADVDPITLALFLGGQASPYLDFVVEDTTASAAAS